MSEALNRFVASVDSLVEAGGEAQSDFWDKLGDAMRELVACDDWLPEAMAQPHPQYYQQYCLYADPDDRFSVVSFVWGPGQATPIHDHTVWGVIGMLRGAEVCQAYEITEQAPPKPIGKPERLESGHIGFVAPSIGDVHRVSNAFDDRVSISIHAYGGNIGKINRHVFPEDGGPTKSFVSGYSAPAAL
ncbi:cysteine dioxygenase [Orrella daihaiensis]|uniref:Cysteine dioxygenase n=1 Tax=Orrella daihaiensis TaxID=2782176 RepID=A0ABY4ANU4_9BURK|nr:cysteine dioxygenase [Orrella daihaiensis]UOD49714.1 cysteine dioxygenase [Orrella daihaiensis]